MGQDINLPGNNNGLNNIGGLLGGQIGNIQNLGANTGDISTLAQQLANPGPGLLGGGNLGTAQGTLGSFLQGGNPVDISAFQEQGNQAFQDLIAPNINEQFGALGLRSSSAREGEIGRAAAGLQSNIAAQGIASQNQAAQRQLASLGIAGDQLSSNLQSQAAGLGGLTSAAGLDLQGQTSRASEGGSLLRSLIPPTVGATSGPAPLTGGGGAPRPRGIPGGVRLASGFQRGGEVGRGADGLLNIQSGATFGGREDLGDFLSNLVFGRTFNRPDPVQTTGGGGSGFAGPAPSQGPSIADRQAEERAFRNQQLRSQAPARGLTRSPFRTIQEANPFGIIGPTGRIAPSTIFTQNTRTGETFMPFAPQSGSVFDSGAGISASPGLRSDAEGNVQFFQEGGEVQLTDEQRALLGLDQTADEALEGEALRRARFGDGDRGPTKPLERGLLSKLIFGALPGLNDPTVSDIMRQNLLGKQDALGLSLLDFNRGGQIPDEALQNRRIPRRLEQGGTVAGPASPPDQVPIMATGGEIVLNPELSNRVKAGEDSPDLLNDIQGLAGKPGKGAGSEFQTGGPVGFMGPVVNSIQDLLPFMIPGGLRGAVPEALPNEAEALDPTAVQPGVQPSPEQAQPTPAAGPVPDQTTQGFTETTGAAGERSFSGTGTPETAEEIQARQAFQAEAMVRIAQEQMLFEQARLTNLRAFSLERPTARLQAEIAQSEGRLKQLEANVNQMGAIQGAQQVAQTEATATVMAAEQEAQGRVAAEQAENPLETLQRELVAGVQAGLPGAREALLALKGVATRQPELLKEVFAKGDAKLIQTVLESLGIQLPGALKDTFFGRGLSIEEAQLTEEEKVQQILQAFDALK
jgi:hypothetical protein